MKEFELREERTIHYPNGVTKVVEKMVTRSNEDQISQKYLDLKVGHRRNVRDDEDFSGEVIYSVVRVK